MKLAVFYHAFPSGPGVDINHGLAIVREQMAAVESSGLLSTVNELYIGVAGGEPNTCAVAMIAPEMASVAAHGPQTCGELPTLCALQEWLPGHGDWGVLYFHTKGALYQGNGTWDAWRRCMMSVVISDWRKCVADLEQGFDCAGPHWLTPARYPIIGQFPYFAGTFWWARGSYLETLPRLDPNGPSRYEAEVWIGRSKKRINARGYADHWPGAHCL